jgi:hypothetical protein
VASQSGGAGGGSHQGTTRTVLTAAMVKHVAAASQAAMTSGEADINWTGGGQSAVAQDITFDGANWNDVLNPGQPMHKWRIAHGWAWTGETINRVVDGQQYHWPAATMTPKGIQLSGWMEIPAPTTGNGLDIPDPRTLLGVLSPSAGFVTGGTTTLNGTTVTQLRATTPGAVPITPLNDIIDSEPDHAQLSAIDLWVDANDVVQKAVITVSGTSASGAPQSVTVTVTFTDIGQVQPITAPATYTTPGDGAKH